MLSNFTKLDLNYFVDAMATLLCAVFIVLIALAQVGFYTSGWAI